MATTTTIRLSDDLKERISSAAKRAGKTTHSFILEAIAEKAELEERRVDFDREADARFARIVQSGETIPWTEMRQRLGERLAGEGSSPQPKTKTRE